MQIIRQIYNEILKSDKVYKIITIITEGDKVEIAKDSDVLEIGVPKVIYLNMFKQAHTYFYESYDPHDVNEDVYFMTLVYLITTNENSTILNIHEKIVSQLALEVVDFEIITCFLNTRIQRINKSSSLWFYLKKLTIDLGFVQDQNKLDLLMRRCLKSCQIHYANYYANNFMRWLITMSKLNGMRYNYNSLIDVCRENLSDSSIWHTLGFYLSTPSPLLLRYVIDEYESIANKPLINKLVVDHDENLTEEQFQWLIKAQCKYLTPFKTLLDSSNDKSKYTKYILQIEDEKIKNSLYNSI